MRTLDELKSIGTSQSDLLEINFDILESNSMEREYFENTMKSALEILSYLEEIHAEAQTGKVLDVISGEEIPLTEDAKGAIEHELIQGYTLRTIYERYNLINNITHLV